MYLSRSLQHTTCVSFPKMYVLYTQTVEHTPVRLPVYNTTVHTKATTTVCTTHTTRCTPALFVQFQFVQRHQRTFCHKCIQFRHQPFRPCDAIVLVLLPLWAATFCLLFGQLFRYKCMYNTCQFHGG